MKKILILCILLFLGFFMTTGTSYANNDDFPAGRNYLDLNQLIQRTDKQNAFKTNDSFKIKEQSTYTLVMSKSFLMDLYDDIESKYLTITHEPSGYNPEYYYTKDLLNERVYIEIEPSSYEGDNYLYLEDITLPATHQLTNYEIILYEGTYDDFIGFEPYLAPNEEIIKYGHMVLNYDELLSTETIQSFVNAKDPIGNDLVVEVIQDTYTTSDKHPGTYEMIFETMHNNITKQYVLSVLVEDLTPPSISVDNPIQIELSQKVSLQTILSYIEVSDNVDYLTYHNLTVISETYSDAAKTGKYHITVEAMDSSGNKNTETFEIKIMDTTSPTIKGPSQIFIYISDPTMTHEDVLSYFQFKDDVELDLESIGFSYDSYMQTQTPGVYQMTIEAYDIASNLTTKDIYIHVIDNRGPEFHVNDSYIMHTVSTEIKTESEIINWLKSTLQDEGIHVENVTIDYNEYALKANQNGQYYVYMTYEVDDQTYQTRVMIDVTENLKFYQNPIYLLTLLPVGGFIGYIIYRKKKVKI